MTTKGPVLVEVREEIDVKQLTEQPRIKSPTRITRDIVVAGISALIGAGLAIGTTMLQENLRLGNHVPVISISSVQVYSPELTVPNKDMPSPPSRIDRELEVLTKHLGLTDK